jgi:hypothetical protein
LLNMFGMHVWGAVATSVIIKRVIPLLVLAACGVHAYVQYKRRGDKMPTPERWMFLAFSFVFLFGTVANFGAAVLSWKVGSTRGPFAYGGFSLLIALLYLVFSVGVGQRRRF